jgi:hypothetical protein
MLNTSDSRSAHFSAAVAMVSKLIRDLEKNVATKQLSRTPRWGKRIKEVWRWTFMPKEKPERPPLLETMARLFAADLKKFLAILQKKVGRADLVSVMQKLTPAAAPLYGKPFSSGSFQLKFLKKIKQRETLIGRFANITNNTMYFDNGEHCWKTDAGRTFELQLVCSEENVFLEAAEPTTCIYKGVFGTPIACTANGTDGVDQLSLKKLEKLMDELHLNRTLT